MKWQSYKLGAITKPGIYLLSMDVDGDPGLLTVSYNGAWFYALPYAAFFDPTGQKIDKFLQITQFRDGKPVLIDYEDGPVPPIKKTGSLWEVAKARAAYDRGHSNFGKMLYENTEQIELMYEEAAEWYHKLKTMGVRTVTGPFEMKVNGTVIYSSNDSAL